MIRSFTNIFPVGRNLAIHDEVRKRVCYILCLEKLAGDNEKESIQWEATKVAAANAKDASLNMSDKVGLHKSLSVQTFYNV